jgi:hypothetical protein
VKARYINSKQRRVSWSQSEIIESWNCSDGYN